MPVCREKEVAVKHTFGLVFLDPDGHFKVVHFFHMGACHVLLEAEALDLSSSQREHGALGIGQHLHHHMVERGLAVVAHVVVCRLFTDRNIHADIVHVGEGHEVGGDVDGVALNEIGTFDFDRGGCVVMRVEVALCHGVKLVTHAVHEEPRHGIHSVVGLSGAAFASIIRVAGRRPVHLVFYIGVFARVVVAEGLHLCAELWACAAGGAGEMLKHGQTLHCGAGHRNRLAFAVVAQVVVFHAVHLRDARGEGVSVGNQVGRNLKSQIAERGR